MKFWRYYTPFLMAIGLLLAACGGRELPSLPDLPVDVDDLPINVEDFPGLPEGLSELPGILEDLGLPDIGQLEDLPALSDLPFLGERAGTILYNGPLERRMQIGDFIPGTKIRLSGVESERALFEIEGLRSERSAGDALDFDGPWPGIDGVTYNLRTRIYRISGDSIRIAGVHQIVVDGISPVAADVY